ncbi:gag/pol protein [Cucumis melo var. makuwa]|uniref:Gag/pol protein n=1 Tax=Cucumis melo var. makuwa TaxID=1194695 RepID=A0A5A7TTZ2_CUCMM|nr:gag/pol protein [Cucumis melo var. makuwa]
MVTTHHIMDSLQKVFKGQIEGEASKKKGAKGKRLAAAVKGKEKEAKVVDKGKSFLCNVSGHLKTIVHIFNNVSSKIVSKTPFELWRGPKPSLSHFRIYSCPTHVLVTNLKKLKPRLRLSYQMMVLRIHCSMTMNNVDKDQWVEAMDLEMKSIYFNSMWELVVLPEGVKPRTALLNDNLEESIFMSEPKEHEVHLSKEQYPKTPQEVKDMRRIPYASVVDTLMYVMLCTRPDICYAMVIVSRYQSNPRELWYGVASSKDACRLNYGAAYVAACKAAKEAIWLRKFL